jgi:hypothetical protein
MLMIMKNRFLKCTSIKNMVIKALNKFDISLGHADSRAILTLELRVRRKEMVQIKTIYEAKTKKSNHYKKIKINSNIVNKKPSREF